ncbi:hypothetical protein TrST_g14356 [Triparma strigata]|uniref:20 kDa chaperonin, chloroplastic n=1 Tax=Triparma strigata TaxID=1606541 RepID=A0A9W7B429_9STRA|nr:hypothetical protein TrST_g14356 [Triparma strigata]
MKLLSIALLVPLFGTLVSGFTFTPTSRQSFATRLHETATLTLDGRPLSNPIEPTNNFLLIRVDESPDETDGGIILTKKAKVKSTTGCVVAAGPGKTHPDSGIMMPVNVAPGQNVIYGQYDGTEISYNSKPHTLIRSDDVLVFFDGEKITTENVKVEGDKMLVRVDTKEVETAGGLLIAATAQKETRPSVGEVVAVGTGRVAMNGEVIPMEVKVGDMVKFRDYAGNEVKIGEEEFSVIRMNDCLARY